MQWIQADYAAGALLLTAAGAGAAGAAGTAGAAVPELIVPASIVVPQELHPVETGAAAPHPQLGAAGAAQPQDRARRPQDGAGAAQPQDGAGAASQPHVGAGAGQHVGAGAGAGQHVGAGAQHDGAPPQRLAFLA